MNNLKICNKLRQALVRGEASTSACFVIYTVEGVGASGERYKVIYQKQLHEVRTLESKDAHFK